MFQSLLALLALAGASQVSSECMPAESSKHALSVATAIVQRLPELAGWAHSNSVVLDTGSRERIGGVCFESVFVYAVNPDKDLDLRYIFAIYLPTKKVMVMDIPNAEFLPLKEWRISKTH